VDLIHQDFETTVNDFVDFFGIKHFGDRRIVGDVGKQNGYQLALTFNGTAGGENFIRKELGRIGRGFTMVNRGAIFRATQIITTLIAKFAADPVGSMAHRAGEIKFMTTLVTKFGPFSVLEPALRAFHFDALHLL
jgi:hypothetical protein